jgi:aspartyl-tRNA(Asn)/glutamyl-tRNA(Gln) amidotransferase subunit A
VPVEYNVSELTPSVRRAWLLSLAHLEKQGHTLCPISLPTTKLALSAYYVLAPAEASSNLAKYDGVRYGTRAESPDSEEGPDGYLYAKTRGEGFGAEVKRRILLGSFSLSADAMDNFFVQAQRVRRLVQADFDTAFSTQSPLSGYTLGRQKNESPPAVDVLVVPTAPSTPTPLPSPVDSSNPSSQLNAYVTDVFTVPASLAGLPAISVPVSISKSASPSDRSSSAHQAEQSKSDSSHTEKVGIQIIGQYGDDELVLKVGEILEYTKFVQ